jgi:hypothetical protein
MEWRKRRRRGWGKQRGGKGRGRGSGDERCQWTVVGREVMMQRS